jgi:hypothetical protein
LGGNIVSNIKSDPLFSFSFALTNNNMIVGFEQPYLRLGVLTYAAKSSRIVSVFFS